MAATGGCSRGGLPTLAAPAIRAASELWGTPLQLDAGEMVVMATAGDGFLVASIDSPATGVIVQVDGGGPVAAKRVDGGFMATLPMPERGEHLLVVRGLDFGVQTAYRAVDFDVNG